VSEPEPFGDAITRPFWEAASLRRLVIQRCTVCGHHQFYPRRFCLSCDGADLGWVDAAGTGTVYAATTVRLQVIPELQPPYQVALVELDEGPRLTANIVGEPCRMGDRVRVAWRERPDAPPLPVFESAERHTGGWTLPRAVGEVPGEAGGGGAGGGGRFRMNGTWLVDDR